MVDDGMFDELERIRESRDHWQILSESRLKRLIYLYDENDKLREALTFYADPDSWGHIGDGSYDVINDSDIEIDSNGEIGGKLAREVLKELDERKES